MRMKAFLVKGVFMFAALAFLTSIFIGISDAQVSAVASFNDPRCDGGMVCPNDPLLFTCTVTKSTATAAEVTLLGVVVQVTSGNMVQVVGATSLPDGVTEQSHSAIVDGLLANYTLTLAIERASLLGGNATICDAKILSMLNDSASCPIATDPPAPPESLSQDVPANTETSAVVQWRSPAMTGDNGVTISEYTVTVVDSVMTQTVSHDDSGGVFTATIPVPDFNTSYSVSVTAINSCGLSSQPATTTVFIEARPPPQRELLVQMSCDTVLAGGRPISINWTDGVREGDGVIYPEESVQVELTSLRGNVEQVCNNVTGCNFNITESDNYTVSLNVTNDVGSFIAMTTFSSEILFSDETLNSLPPSVNITVNRACATDDEPFQIRVRFGVTTAGGSCLYMGDIETVNSSPKGNIFSSNIIPKTGQSFCYMANLTIGTNFASLNGSGDITPTEPPDPNQPNIGLIIGVVVAAVVLIILVVAFVSIVRFFFMSKNKRQKESQEIPLRSRQDPGSPGTDPEGGPMYQEADSVPRTAHPETGELYTNVGKPRNTEQAPTSIEHHEGPSGDLYAMPQTSGKKEKKKGKGREEEAEQQELAEEEKAALYSVPDKKGQKAKSQGLNYSELAFQSSAKPAPPSQGSYYADIKLDK